LNLFKRIINWFKKFNEYRRLQRENDELKSANSALTDELQYIYKHTEARKLLRIIHSMSYYETNIKKPTHHPERINQMNVTLDHISKIIAGESDHHPFWLFSKRMLDEMPIWRLEK
jgi:hypothetical protein